eukprot:225937_1
MFRFITLAVILVSVVDASQYYYMSLGPWGLDSAIVNANAVRKGTDDLKEVKTTSRKAGKDEQRVEVEEVKSNLIDDLEEAEKALFHAVEDAVTHAIDDEVETLFPHHKKTEGE